MKIHMSMETKLLLDTLGRFHTEHRGLVDVKGKGQLDTYWLLGKEGWVGKLYDTDVDYDTEEGPAYMKVKNYELFDFSLILIGQLLPIHTSNVNSFFF